MDKEDNLLIPKSMSNDGNFNKLRRRRMLRQMQRQQNEAEHEFHTASAMKQHEKDLMDTMFRRNVSAVVVLLFVGVIAVVYFRPKIFFSANESLPRRTITTVYPRNLKIAKALPTVVMGYAIVSPNNERERAVVRRIAAQRKIITTPAHGTKQMILYSPIEHDDFVHKLINSQPGALDYFCGNGYQLVYQRQSKYGNSNGQALDDMLIATIDNGRIMKDVIGR